MNGLTAKSPTCKRFPEDMGNMGGKKAVFFTGEPYRCGFGKLPVVET